MITEWEKVFATYNIDKEFESGIYEGLFKKQIANPKRKMSKTHENFTKKEL